MDDDDDFDITKYFNPEDIEYVDEDPLGIHEVIYGADDYDSDNEDYIINMDLRNLVMDHTMYIVIGRRKFKLSRIK